MLLSTSSRRNKGPNHSIRKYSANQDTHLKENLSSQSKLEEVKIDIPIRVDTETVEPSAESPFNLSPKEFISNDQIKSQRYKPKGGFEFKVHQTKLGKAPRIVRQSN